jgi:hypothetical protein
VALHVSLARWAIWVEAEAVFTPQEVAEVELIDGAGRLGEVLVMATWPLHFCRHNGEWVMKAVR